MVTFVKCCIIILVGTLFQSCLFQCSEGVSEIGASRNENRSVKHLEFVPLNNPESSKELSSVVAAGNSIETQISKDNLRSFSTRGSNPSVTDNVVVVDGNEKNSTALKISIITTIAPSAKDETSSVIADILPTEGSRNSSSDSAENKDTVSADDVTSNDDANKPNGDVKERPKKLFDSADEYERDVKTSKLKENNIVKTPTTTNNNSNDDQKEEILGKEEQPTNNHQSFSSSSSDLPAGTNDQTTTSSNASTTNTEDLLPQTNNLSGNGSSSSNSNNSRTGKYAIRNFPKPWAWSTSPSFTTDRYMISNYVRPSLSSDLENNIDSWKKESNSDWQPINGQRRPQGFTITTESPTEGEVLRKIVTGSGGGSGYSNSRITTNVLFKKKLASSTTTEALSPQWNNVPNSRNEIRKVIAASNSTRRKVSSSAGDQPLPTSSTAWALAAMKSHADKGHQKRISSSHNNNNNLEVNRKNMTFLDSGSRKSTTIKPFVSWSTRLQKPLGTTMDPIFSDNTKGTASSVEEDENDDNDDIHTTMISYIMELEHIVINNTSPTSSSSSTKKPVSKTDNNGIPQQQSNSSRLLINATNGTNDDTTSTTTVTTNTSFGKAENNNLMTLDGGGAYEAEISETRLINGSSHSYSTEQSSGEIISKINLKREEKPNDMEDASEKSGDLLTSRENAHSSEASNATNNKIRARINSTFSPNSISIISEPNVVTLAAVDEVPQNPDEIIAEKSSNANDSVLIMMVGVEQSANESSQIIADELNNAISTEELNKPETKDTGLSSDIIKDEQIEEAISSALNISTTTTENSKGAAFPGEQNHDDRNNNSSSIPAVEEEGVTNELMKKANGSSEELTVSSSSSSSYIKDNFTTVTSFFRNSISNSIPIIPSTSANKDEVKPLNNDELDTTFDFVQKQIKDESTDDNKTMTEDRPLIAQEVENGSFTDEETLSNSIPVTSEKASVTWEIPSSSAKDGNKFSLKSDLNEHPVPISHAVSISEKKAVVPISYKTTTVLPTEINTSSMLLATTSSTTMLSNTKIPVTVTTMMSSNTSESKIPVTVTTVLSNISESKIPVTVKTPVIITTVLPSTKSSDEFTVSKIVTVTSTAVPNVSTDATASTTVNSSAVIPETSPKKATKSPTPNITVTDLKDNIPKTDTSFTVSISSSSSFKTPSTITNFLSTSTTTSTTVTSVTSTTDNTKRTIFNSQHPSNIPAYFVLVFRSSAAQLCHTSHSLKDSLFQYITRRSFKIQSPDQIIMVVDPDQCKNPDDATKLIPVTMYIVDGVGSYDQSIIAELKRILQKEEVNVTSPIHEIVYHENALSGETKVIAIVSIACIAVVSFIMLLVLGCMIRNRQKHGYGQRCTPVSMDDYSLDNISVYNSGRRKNILRASRRSYGNPAFDDPSGPSKPLNYTGLLKAIENRSDLDEEFSQIPAVSVRPEELPPGAETKNRYSNVIPLPETRVSLSSNKNGLESVQDYINANYVKGCKGLDKFYIACQAPLQSTIEDFWKMIWKEQSKVIIMLTGLVENGVEKCADYLPPSEVLDCNRLFGDFQVTLKKREVREKYVMSSLQLKNMESNLWREITHFWYTSWPVQGVPAEHGSIIAMLLEARSYMFNNTSPLVVHCSPGTGRTGTIIVCDICIREYEQTRTVNVPAVVSMLRRCRAGCVQTKDQYSLIYKVLALYAKKLNDSGSLDSI